MAEHDGRLFCSTLPTGKIFAYEAGRQVTWDHAFPTGQHHVVAVKSKQHLRLYVDGQLVAQSPAFLADTLKLAGPRLLRLGDGVQGPFPGELRQIRLYQRALHPEEIRALAASR
jgi:hypothetical protein